MRIITLETLKTMPNGTVFCGVDEWGNFDGELTILTGKYDDCDRFNGVMDLLPRIPEKEDGENGFYDMIEDGKLITDKDFPTEWITVDTSDIDYDENQLFVVFSKAEIGKMINVLQWALSDLEDDFDMDEVLI